MKILPWHRLDDWKVGKSFYFGENLLFNFELTFIISVKSFELLCNSVCSGIQVLDEIEFLNKCNVPYNVQICPKSSVNNFN